MSKAINQQRNETVGQHRDDLASLAGNSLANGIAPIFVDASGRAPVADAPTVLLSPLNGLAQAFAPLPVIKGALEGTAARRLPDAVLPSRACKVASAEVA